MADFGLAAQIGRGNAMPGAQQQDPQNRMMQMMQLQQLQQNMMLAREQEGRAALYACGARIAVAAHLKALRTDAYERKQSRGGR